MGPTRLVLLVAVALCVIIPTVSAAITPVYYYSNSDCSGGSGSSYHDNLPNDGTCVPRSDSSDSLRSVKLTCTGTAWTYSFFSGSSNCNTTGSATQMFTYSGADATCSNNNGLYLKVDCAGVAGTRTKTTTYTGLTCSGDVLSVVYDDPLTGCTKSGFSTYNASMGSCDAEASYSARYFDDQCTDLSSVSRTRLLCRTGYQSSSLVSCMADGASSGSVDIPSSFIGSTEYKNTSVDARSDPTSCSSSDVIIKSQSAFITGRCVPNSRTSTTDFTAQNVFCSKNKGFAISASYTDRACTNLARVSIDRTGCDSGAEVECGDDAASPNEELPTIGYVRYPNSGCVSPSGSSPTLYAFKPDTCYNRAKYTCTTDATTGVKALVRTRYNTGDCTGTATSVDTFPGDGSTCSENYYKYNCGFVSGGVGGIVGLTGDAVFEPAGTASSGLLSSAPSMIASLIFAFAIAAQRML